MNYPLQATKIRKNILNSVYKGGGGHLGGCFSIIDFMVVLYHKFLNIDPLNPDSPDRDRMILSKGHCSLALYWILAEKGFFNPQLISNYGSDGANLAGHPELGKAPGIEASTGSLGHGPSIGVGCAIAAKSLYYQSKIFVICGDGEMNEGSVWEAIMCASQMRLDNFYLIIDNNKLESLDFTNNIISIEPIDERLKAFGFSIRRLDGHDHIKVAENLQSLFEEKNDKPKAIILDTIKGKGLSFTELVSKWHFRSPTADEYERGIQELDAMEVNYAQSI